MITEQASVLQQAEVNVDLTFKDETRFYLMIINMYGDSGKYFSVGHS